EGRLQASVGEPARVIVKALISPAKNISSVPTKTSMPNTLAGTTSRRRRTAGAADTPVVMSVPLRMAGPWGRFLVQLLPVMSLALEHVRRDPGEHHQHDRQHDDHDEHDPLRLDVHVHEVLRDHPGLHDGDTERGDERHHADPQLGPDDADDEE